MDAMRATYGITIQPVNSEEFWETSDALRPVAPAIKRPPGRPRKRRTTDPVSESQLTGNKVKKAFEVTCSKCEKKGHYYKTCKGSPRDPNWQPKKKKARNAKGDNQAIVIPKSGAAPSAVIDPIAKARKHKKKIPRNVTPVTLQQAGVEIPVSQSAPTNEVIVVINITLWLKF
ncbi:uncharacterized protein LOC110266117 [Arachis ipaensis]|uniref:uncharacterized protein LOC110266117 n=1 Tax=Arachis ipaensis TaxID=130454 RepID=UPI000A2B33A7|nr:uncharacterized protein LOC110266117 [Arachis ipaensis]